MRIHPLTGGVIIGLVLVSMLALIPQHVKDIPVVTNIEFAKKLYRNVKKTHISQTSQRLFSNVVEKRLKCYARDSDYLYRIQECNYHYVDRIIQQARGNIDSIPSVGHFARNVRACPVVYSICMGESNGDSKQCISMELRCIDYNLDRYWRGVNAEDWSLID